MCIEKSVALSWEKFALEFVMKILFIKFFFENGSWSAVVQWVKHGIANQAVRIQFWSQTSINTNQSKSRGKDIALMWWPRNGIISGSIL